MIVDQIIFIRIIISKQYIFYNLNHKKIEIMKIDIIEILKFTKWFLYKIVSSLLFEINFKLKEN
jgi:hypothetical protein